MSTRYVWEKSDIKSEFEKTKTVAVFATSEVKTNTSYALCGYLADGVTFVTNEATGNVTATPTGQITSAYGQNYYLADPSHDPSYYGYFFLKQSGNTIYLKATTPGYWYPEGNFNWSPNSVVGGVGVLFYDQNTSEGKQKAIDVYSVVDSKGSFVSNVSSATPTAYPTNADGGAENGYWYTYKGSDNIDPISISYQTTDLEQGQNITISVSASNSIQYGGPISYQYQYRRNGGSWTTLTTTTSTDTSYTIPDGTTSIQFRALASDNMGFTSATYVTGAVAEVESPFKAYIGVNNIARQVTKIYIGVNGKAREVVKGYIGVNGKAQQFL